MDLDINDELYEIWNRYIHQLSMDRISLNHDVDKIYFHDDATKGHISIKGIYNYISSSHGGPQDKCWFYRVWSWHMPINIFLSNWLVWRNKVLTWENLCKRGFEGPGKCSLCHESYENC